MAQPQVPSPELDADLENDLLEWSEDNNIDNSSLVSLFNLLKSHNLKKEQEPSITTSKSQDKKCTSEENLNFGDRLANLEIGQQTIIKEISKLLSSNKLNMTIMNTENSFDEGQRNFPFFNLTAEEFVDLENKCKNSFNFQEKLKSVFMNILEDDLKKFIHNCMQRFMNDECAVKFSWCGKMNSIAIKDFVIIAILKECVHTVFSGITEQNVIKNIEAWFHRAPDRIKLKTKRKSETSDVVDKYDIIEDFDNNDEIEDLSYLPCKTIAEFKTLDANCKSNSYLEDKLRSLFTSCSKYDVSNFIDSNMRLLLTEEIITEVSWTGINTKLCLRNMITIKILIEVIMERFQLDCEDKVIPLIRRWTYSIRDRNLDNSTAYPSKPIKLEGTDRTTIEMEFIDPLNMPYQEEYDYYEDEDIDIISSLPCITNDQFDKLEKLCEENQKLQYDLKEFFKKTKNLDYKSFTDYNMRQMISDDVANSIKMSVIKEYTTINAIKEAIFDTFPEVSDFEALDAIKIFLYKAQDRYRKKQVRVSIKREQEDGGDSQNISQENLSLDGYEDDYDDEPAIEDISNLPCLTYRQFLKFEKRFRMDENLKSDLKELFLSESDETSLKKFIDINFKKIMEDEATILCIWGTGFSSALSLKNFGIVKLLRECALEVFPHITTELVNDDIRSFLYRTKERVKRKSLKVQGSSFITTKKRKYNRSDVKVKNESFNIFGLAFNFPLSTVEAFEEFEKQCQDNEEYQENLEMFYKRMKNCDNLTFIDKNIRKLINDEVSGAFTWHGRQGNKSAKDFTCIKVLKDCVENIFPNITEKEIIDSFTRAFRRAKDRKFHTSKSNLDDSIDLDSNVQDTIDSFVKEETKMDFDGNGYDSVEENDSIIHGSEIDYNIMNLSCLPFHAVDDFKKFEKMCRQNKTLQTNLRNHFDSHREMLDPKKFTAENLRKMLPDDLAAQFSYAGQQKNISIKNYTTMKILKEVTMTRYNLVDSMAISILKRCFYMVKDRVRIRNKLKIKLENGDIKGSFSLNN